MLSTKNLLERIKRHNQGRNKSTKPYRPWAIVYTEKYISKSQVAKREFHLKSTKGYREYRNIKSKVLGGVA